MSSESGCRFEAGFKAGFQAGLMAGANGAKPEFMYADADMARRFGVRHGEQVRVYYGDDGKVIGAFTAS